MICVRKRNMSNLIIIKGFGLWVDELKFVIFYMN